ncbi:MAG: hypothetical protein ABR953_12930 [Candidatus Acidiferrales bacterium]
MATNIHAAGAEVEIKEPEYSALAASHEQPCISIFMSDNTPVGGMKQVLTRLKNLLKTAESSFQGFAMTVGEAEDLLKSHWRSVQDNEPVHPGTEGVAIFMSRNFFGRCHLPVAAIERVVVGREFFIRPLLAFVPTNDRFFVLALSQKHVKLFEGSRRGIRERTMKEVPESLREDLQGLHFERRYQMHTASSPASRQKGAVYHGPSLDSKDRLVHFFRDIDRGVAASLKGQQAPLVVASVDYLFPIYKEANTYPHLLEEMVTGNPDLLSPYALHAASWRIIEKQLSETRARAFAVYQAHANSSRTSSNLRKVVTAAERGLVRFLFLPSEGEQWGLLADPETVHVHSGYEPGDDELLNLAAILTIRRGGHVYVVPPNELPEGAEVTAVFRF